jgi:regulatory protein
VSLSKRGIGPSLIGRALRLLTQREHSRLELARKLKAHAESPDALQTVLDALERRGLLSDQRFAESLAHRRSSRFGLRRIQQELQTHKLDASVSAPVIEALRGSERARAREAWLRRFGGPPQDATERARQHRFLAQRGFTSDAIGWVLKHGVCEDAEVGVSESVWGREDLDGE